MMYHLVGFALALGWIFPFYALPIFSFYQEWLVCAAVGSLLLTTVFFPTRHIKPLRIPISAWFVVIYACVGVVQILLHRHPDPLTVVIFMGAGAVFAGAVVIGANISAENALKNVIGREEGLSILFRWIFVTGIISSLMVLMQVLDLDIYFFPLIRSPDLKLNRPSANFGQPNLLTLQIAIGLVAAAYLYEKNKIRGYLLCILIAPQLLAIFFANTRAYLLMSMAIAICALFLKGSQSKALRIWAFIILPGWFLISTPFHGEVMSYFGHVGRESLSPVTQPDGRLKIWMGTLQMIKENPWLGSGVGAYAVGFYDVAQSPVGTVGPNGNAHNIFLHLVAEMGVVFGVLLSGSILLWGGITFRKARCDNSKLHFFAIIAIIFAHSLVEFPLWFAFFLVPCGIFVGLLDDDFTKANKINHFVSAGLAFFVISLCSWSYFDFNKLKYEFEDALTIGNSSAIDEARQSKNLSVFDWYFRYVKFLVLDEKVAGAENLWEIGNSVIRRFPFGRSLTRYAYISTLVEKDNEAIESLTVLYRMRPNSFSFYKNQNLEYCELRIDPVNVYCKLHKMAEDIEQNLSKK